jgi:hypothetical protein
MIRIAITQAAYDALASTIPLGSVAFEKELDANGQCHVRLNRAEVDRLRSLRGAGESYSDVILRIAARTAEPRGLELASSGNA